MKKSTGMKKASLGFALCGALLSQPLVSLAQEAPMAPGGQTGAPGASGAEGKEKFRNMMNEMQQRRQQMEQERQAALQELRRQVATLQAHTKTMAPMTDEKQLLAEVKKHQQMSDTLLNALARAIRKDGTPPRSPSVRWWHGRKNGRGRERFLWSGKRRLASGWSMSR